MTIDAMFCQTKIAKAITSKGDHYLFAVKGNQGKLSAAVHTAFARLCCSNRGAICHLGDLIL
ncbi:hypothetical protein JD499_01700 [Aeromonas enteropelogenes]|nr:hypothetical protein [Aeromonas enteropelogenes]